MRRRYERSDAIEEFRRKALAMQWLNFENLADFLALGGVGYVVGVLLPWAFRLVGYVVDTVTAIVR